MTIYRLAVLALVAMLPTLCQGDSTVFPELNASLATGQRPVKIVGFGDSITGVYYHSGGRRAWTEMLGLALQRVYPQAKIGEPFELGHRIERVEVRPSAVSLLIGT